MVMQVISLTVAKCMFRDVVNTNTTLLLNITSTANVTFLSPSKISAGTSYLSCHDFCWYIIFFITTWSWAEQVVFTFIEPKLGPKMSLALRMSCLVTAQLGSKLLPTYLIRSLVVCLPMMFWGECAFLVLEYSLTYLLVLSSTDLTSANSSRIALYSSMEIHVWYHLL